MSTPAPTAAIFALRLKRLNDMSISVYYTTDRMQSHLTSRPTNITFTAKSVKGSGKGRGMGFPTINLDLADVPGELSEGVYAACTVIDGTPYTAAMHYGPRPVHQLPRSCELHIVTREGLRTKDKGRGTNIRSVTVEVIERLRDVRDFESEEELKRQIVKDIERVKK